MDQLLVKLHEWISQVMDLVGSFQLSNHSAPNTAMQRPEKKDFIKPHEWVTQEAVVFKHRAKVLGWNPEIKRWKEKGVGDMEILKHSQLGRVRVRLRQDQTPEMVCNHEIIKDVKVQSMSEEPNGALCWCGMNLTGRKRESIGVKFALAETRNAFKAAFEIAQKEISASSQNRQTIY